MYTRRSEEERGTRPPDPVAGLLLAAGLSTRMGMPKPLLPWDGRTLVEYQVAQLWAAGVADVLVVTGHAAAAVAEVLRTTGARVVYNPSYAAGRAGSVRVGAGAVPDGMAVLVLNVDQPRPASLTRALLEAGRAPGALITVPVYRGRRGHPTLFAASLLPELRAVSEEHEGLRAVLRAYAGAVYEAPAADPRVVLDVNTPAAYREALRAFGIAGGKREEGGGKRRTGPEGRLGSC